MKLKKGRGNPKYTQISVYVIGTAIVIYVLFKIASHTGDILGAVGTGLYWTGFVLKPLIGGFALAYLLNPLVVMLERRLDKGLTADSPPPGAVNPPVDQKKRGRLSRLFAGRKTETDGPAGAENYLPGAACEENRLPGADESNLVSIEEAAPAVKPKSHRGLAVALTFIIVFAIIVIAFSIIISAISNQVRMISLDDVTSFINSISRSLKDINDGILSMLKQLNIDSKDLNDMLQSVGNKAADLASSLSQSVVQSLTKMTSFFTNLLFAIIFAVYFLLDSKNLKEYWDKVLKAISTKRFYAGFHRLITDMDVVFSGYIRGQLIDAFLICILISVSLSIVGVKFAVLIGILTGIGNLIPYVGPIVAYVSTITVCFLQQDLKLLVIACLVILVIQLIDGNIINPKLLSTTIEVHPMLIIVALIAGSAVGGILGMLLAVPVASLIKLYFDRFIEILIRKRQIKAAAGETGAGTMAADEIAADETAADASATDRTAADETAADELVTDAAAAGMNSMSESAAAPSGPEEE